MQRLINFLAFSFALVVLVVSFPSAVSAQERVSFKLSPTTIEDKVDPGADHTYILKIQNLGQESATLYPSAQNITGIGPDLHPIYSTANDLEGFSLASWVSYQEKELVLAPGQSKELHISVHFPADASPGSHMASVFLSDKPSDAIRNGSAIGFQVGAILNFQMAGEIVENTQIREFYTTKMIYGDPNVGFTVRLENLGNVLSRPHGLIDVTNMFGKKVASLPVNINGAGVFPKGTREFTADWKPDDLQIGRYEAIVALAVDGTNGTQTLSRIVQFWVLPMNVLLPFLGGFLLFVIIFYFLLRLYIRRQLASVRSGRGMSQNATGLSRLSAIIIALLTAIILGLIILFFFFG